MRDLINLSRMDTPDIAQVRETQLCRAHGLKLEPEEWNFSSNMS